MRKTIHIPIYEMYLYLIISKDVKKTINSLQRKYNEELSISSMAGCVFTPNENLTKIYLVLQEDYLDLNTISHEINHAQWYILEYRNVNDMESSANLAGFLTEKVHNAILSKFSIKS